MTFSSKHNIVFGTKEDCKRNAQTLPSSSYLSSLMANQELVFDDQLDY